MIRTMLIDLNRDKLCYYPFIINLGMYGGIFNAVESPSGRICVLKKIEFCKFEII